MISISSYVQKYKFSVSLLALAVVSVFGFSADTVNAQVASAKLKPTESTSVIRTSDTKKARALLKQHALREVSFNKLPNGDALIVVDTAASDAKLKSIKQSMKSDSVFSVATNHTYRPTAAPNDPLYMDGSQWNLAKTEAEAGWDITSGSSDTTIAVIDSGVLSNQSWANSPDCSPEQPCTLADFPAEKMWSNTGEKGLTTLEGAAPNCTSRSLPLDKSCNNRDDDNNGYIDDHQGWDFMGGWRGNGGVCPNYTDGNAYNDPTYIGYVAADNDPQPYACDSPNYPNQLNMHHYNGSCTMFESACYTNHGTAAASLAGSATNNSALVAGVNWNAKIMPLRAMDAYGWTDSAHITAAVEYATAMKADAVNVSLAVFTNGSCTVIDSTLETALSKAHAAGTVVVAAAGNGGSQGVCYPAKSKYAIAVGASDQNDARASFSTYGPELDVIAPGVNLAAAISPSKSSNNYRNYSLTAYGTSFATPQVTGLAALVRSLDPTLTTEEVKAAIQRGATKVSAMNGNVFTNEHGYGRMNIRGTLAIDRTTLSTPQYFNLAAPRDLKLSGPTQKTDLLTGQKVGATFSRNQVFFFNQEAYIDGVQYLRTKTDSDAGYHLGFPYTVLRETTRTK